MVAHTEGKLQIALPEGGRELLSLLDLQGWMRRAPLGYVMGVADVVRPEASDATPPTPCATPAAARASAAADGGGASQLKSTRRRRAPLGEVPGTPSNANNVGGVAEGDAPPTKDHGTTRGRRGLLSSRRHRQQMEEAVLVD